MFPGQCGNTAFFFKSQPDQFHFEFRGIVFPGKSFFSAHEVSTCKISGCLSYRILDSGPDGTQTTLTNNCEKLVNATASALLAASELSGSIHSRVSRKSPHRRVVELLDETEAITSYRALQEKLLATRGNITQDDWNTELLPLIVSCVKQLSGSSVIGNSVTAFLAWPQVNTFQGEEVTLTQSSNFVSYPKTSPLVQIRLGSIHSVKGE